jgi:hypothetical protein
MGSFPGWGLSLGQRLKAETLSALLGLARRRKGRHGRVAESGEFHHDHSDSHYWNESYYFNFTDPDNKIGGFTRIGMVPNQENANGILYLFLKDGGILALIQSEAIKASRDEVTVGLLQYERVQPLWEWRILYVGKMLYLADPRDHFLLSTGGRQDADLSETDFKDVSVDITFKGWSPCHDFKAANISFIADRLVACGSRLKDLASITKVASEHYEQVGAWTGEIRVDGEKVGIQGSGHRDHSWGERDWKAPERWTWLTAQFGSEFGFNLSRVVIKSLDIFNGYVCRSGNNYPLRRAWLETDFEDDGVTQKGIRLRLQDTTGWEAQVEGAPQTVVPLVLEEGSHRTLVNEAFTAYRWEGRTGYGISEYLHQIGS